MKSVSAYYLLLLYISVLLRPLVPIATDWYAHQFNEIEHMILVHAVYGSHHVEVESGMNKPESDHDKTPGSRSDDQVSVHFSPEEGYNVPVKTRKCNRFPLYKISLIPSISISPLYQPPRFS